MVRFLLMFGVAAGGSVGTIGFVVGLESSRVNSSLPMVIAIVRIRRAKRTKLIFFQFGSPTLFIKGFCLIVEGAKGEVEIDVGSRVSGIL